MKLIPTFKPIFKGYIVDDSAQRFRKITTNKGEPPIYIPLDSPQGRKMRNEFVSLYKYALRKVYKEHINPYGHYTFNVQQELQRKGLRPLRHP